MDGNRRFGRVKYGDPLKVVFMFAKNGCIDPLATVRKRLQLSSMTHCCTFSDYVRAALCCFGQWIRV